MRNMPISTFYGSRDSRRTSTAAAEKVVMDKIEEIEMVEGQIEWFERTRVDDKKRPRYANVNLKEATNYTEFLAEKLAAKR